MEEQTKVTPTSRSATRRRSGRRYARWRCCCGLVILSLSSSVRASIREGALTPLLDGDSIDDILQPKTPGNINSLTRFSNGTEASGSLPASHTRQARYGHGSAYLASTKSLLLFGGQIDAEAGQGTYVSNDVLVFNVSSPYTQAAQDSTTPTVGENPDLVPDLSSGLPPGAWSAVTASDTDVWVIGGVTEDCQNDAPAYVSRQQHLEYPGEARWQPVQPQGSVQPPRRRQAKAVILPASNNSIMSDVTSSIYVWGGVAEKHTCSLEKVAYLAMDIWHLNSNRTQVSSVDVVTWSEATNASHSSSSSSEHTLVSSAPPVVDYTMTALKDSDGIAVVGGQDAEGRLVTMENILVFNTTTQAFCQKTVSGSRVPSARVGHTATRLNDGRILIHGGTGLHSTRLNDTSYILDPRPAEWTWTVPILTKASAPIPNLAWHTSDRVEGDVLIFAYGLNATNLQPSAAVHFLSADEQDGWTWSTSNPLDARVERPPNVVAHANSAASALPSTSGLVQAAQKLLTNSLTRAIDAAETSPPAMSIAPQQPNMSSQQMQSASVQIPAVEPQVSETSLLTSSRASSLTAAHTATPSDNSGTSSDANAQTSASSGTTTKTVAGTVTGVLVAALAAGLLALYVRRRATNSTVTPKLQQADMLQGDPDAPPVSQILYTRRAPQRMLSLGSTASYRSGRTSGYDPFEEPAEDVPAAKLTPRKARYNNDFSKELAGTGRLSPLQPHRHRKRATLEDRRLHLSTIPSTDTLRTVQSRESVAEYPFLTSIPIASRLSQMSGEMRRLSTHLSASHNEHGSLKALVRSQSLSTTSSRYSNTSSSSEGQQKSARVSERDVASAPLPAREWSDPFADSEAVHSARP